MKTTKTVEVRLLPTNEKAKHNELFLNPKTNKLLFFEHQNCTEFKQELYFVDNSEIKDGDWFTNGNYKYQADRFYQKGENDKKVIATTNDSLEIEGDHSTWIKNLPEIPISFIEHYITEYNKSNVITSVELEYEEILGDEGIILSLTNEDYKLKLDQNNCCIPIINVKTSWSKEEVFALITSFNNANVQAPNVLNWINLNL